MGGPGPWSCGLNAAIGHSNPRRWSKDRGPNKTNQAQLSCGNAISKTWVHDLLSNSALDLGFWSTGLGKMVQEPRARFPVTEWGMFCHLRILKIHPARFNRV